MSEKLTAEVKKLDYEICQDSLTNSAAFLRKFKTEQSLGILHDDRPVCSFLRPHFLARSHYQKIVQASEVLTRTFEHLVTVALKDETLLAEFDLTDKEERMARIEPGYQRLCVSNRIDAYWNGDDFKFLEFNGESPAGIADQLQLEKVVEMLPRVQEFLAQKPHWKPNRTSRCFQLWFRLIVNLVEKRKSRESRSLIGKTFQPFPSF